MSTFNDLKKHYKSNGIAARMFPNILRISYVPDLDALCLLDMSNNILTHGEFSEFVAEMKKFYHLVSEQDIIDTNDFERKEQKRNLQMSSPKKVPVAKYVYLISKGNGHFKIGITSNR